MDQEPVGEVEYIYAGTLRIDQRVKWVSGALGTLKSGDKIYAAKPECDWVPDADDCRAFETTCGNAFVLNDGDPRTNGVLFCPYCGGKLKQAVPNVELTDCAASSRSSS